jgi:hypothetical protein
MPGCAHWTAFRTDCNMQCSMGENSKHGSLRDDMSAKCKILKIIYNCDHDDDDSAKAAPLC